MVLVLCIAVLTGLFSCCYGCEDIHLLDTENYDVISHNVSSSTKYPRNTHICWQITSSSKSGLQIKFTEFHLQSQNRMTSSCLDWVRIYKYHGDGAKTLHGTYCGIQTGLSIQLKDWQSLIIFHTDHHIEESGFRIRVSIKEHDGLDTEVRFVIVFCIFIAAVIIIIIIVFLYKRQCTSKNYKFSKKNCKKNNYKTSPSLQNIKNSNQVCPVEDRKVHSQFRRESDNGQKNKSRQSRRESGNEQNKKTTDNEVYSEHKNISNIADGSGNKDNKVLTGKDNYFSKEEIQKRRQSLPKLFIPPPGYVHKMDLRRNTVHVVMKS